MMCCSVLQCVAVCCSVLQCVAVCCSVLQCVAACYHGPGHIRSHVCHHSIFVFDMTKRANLYIYDWMI